jgi:hypothetical protein
MISIAGKAVPVDTPLYHTTMRAWGIVQGYDGAVAILRFALPNDRHRDVRITDGGYSQGIRVAYWHPPLELDLPQASVVKYQRVINLLVAEGL